VIIEVPMQRVWIPRREQWVTVKVHITSWWRHAGSAGITVDVHLLLYGEGVIFCLVLVALDMMEGELIGG